MSQIDSIPIQISPDQDKQTVGEGDMLRMRSRHNMRTRVRELRVSIVTQNMCSFPFECRRVGLGMMLLGPAY